VIAPVEEGPTGELSEDAIGTIVKPSDTVLDEGRPSVEDGADTSSVVAWPSSVVSIVSGGVTVGCAASVCETEVEVPTLDGLFSTLLAVVVAVIHRALLISFRPGRKSSEVLTLNDRAASNISRIAWISNSGSRLYI
jgi:hypothetical protein